MELRETMKTLCESVGISGDEYPAADTALSLLREFAPGAEMDAFQNVMGVVKAAEENQPTILLDAHIDEIGFIVTYIDNNGFLKVGACGGIDRRLVMGQEVVVYGKKPIKGVVSCMPPHLNSGKEDKVPEVENILIDVGMKKDDVKKIVSLGDRATFCAGFHELIGSRVASKAMDDRSCVAVILRTLELIQHEPLNCGVSVQFSVQEETGERGAQIAGYHMNPDIAIALDVSFAHTPDASEFKCGKMGEGVMIGVSPTIDSEISKTFTALAQKHDIPYQTEVMGGATGTNADALGTLRGGIRTGLLSIPLKYMHTPTEVIDLDDCESTARLLAEYLKSFGKETL